MPDNRDILRTFADNEAVMAAVRELLEKQFSTDNLEATDSDILLGQMVRAKLVGLKAIEDAFREIAKYKTVDKSSGKVNPGR